MTTVKLENTFIIRTDDKEFENVLIQFLSNHCDEKKVNATYFGLNEVGAEKVMAIVNENNSAIRQSCIKEGVGNLAYTVEWNPMIASDDVKCTILKLHNTLPSMDVNKVLKIVVTDRDRVLVFSKLGRVLYYEQHIEHADRLVRVYVKDIGDLKQSIE